MLPVAGAAVGVLHAARKQGLVRAFFRPVHQPVGQAIGDGQQRLVSGQVVHTGVTVAQGGAGDAEFQGAVFRCGHVLSPEAFVRLRLWVQIGPARVSQHRDAEEPALPGLWHRPPSRGVTPKAARGVTLS
ncbi:hypothetical protein FQZ97_1125720 [compost metagenome]